MAESLTGSVHPAVRNAQEITRQLQCRTWPQRIGRMLGNWISTGVAIWSGYLWAKHGILRAAELYGGFVVIFGLYGLFKYPWGHPEDA